MFNAVTMASLCSNLASHPPTTPPPPLFLFFFMWCRFERREGEVLGELLHDLLSERDKCKSLEAQVSAYYLGNYAGRQNNFQVETALFCLDDD